MEKIKKFFAHNFLKIFKWAFLVLVCLFIILIIGRVIYRSNEAKTNVEVTKIHNTKLTMDDVMGINLPLDPGVLADQTVEGIDANKNGIRDDVELAVFNEYPNSAKTRAVLLQYALLLQTEMAESIVNKDTATAISEEDSKAFDCIGQIVPKGNNDIQKIMTYRKYIEDKQIDTIGRKDKKNNFDKNSGSFKLQSGCDVSLDLLLN